MKSLPNEIEDEINNLYDKFITLIKGPEKEKIFEKLEIFNIIINEIVGTLKKIKHFSIYYKKKRASFNLNSMYNISSKIE